MVRGSEDPREVTARRVGEVFSSTVGSVASVVSYPIGKALVTLTTVKPHCKCLILIYLFVKYRFPINQHSLCHVYLICQLFVNLAFYSLSMVECVMCTVL